MTIFNIPADIAEASYCGSGTYLAAFAGERLIDIRKVEPPRVPGLPERPKGLRSKAAKAAFAQRLADAWRDRTAAVEAWSRELQAWRPRGADHVVVAGGSCFELVDKFSDLDWQAHDALNGQTDLYFGIAGRDSRAAAYAAVARLAA